MSHLQPDLKNTEKPLVSILVYNYNYGRFLKQCLDSLFAQTYSNIEINFSDNDSNDESWEIALEFVKKYPSQITVTKNRINFGADANFKNCWINARGKYFINMCSDDILEPTYVEECVSALEKNPKVSFAMVHRSIIDDFGKKTEEPPFYNKSCVIPGEEQAAVYMMAAVNPSVSQIMYTKEHCLGNNTSLAGRWYGTRILDFTLCLAHNMIYISKPLLQHRIHGANDSLSAASDLLEIIGPYVLHHQFVELAKPYNIIKVQDRLQPSIEKLAKLSLRYCIRGLINNNTIEAKRYYHLAVAMSYQITEDELFIDIQKYWNSSQNEKEKLLEKFKDASNVVTRQVSYDAPEGSISL